jgi:hypothetical protein
MEMGIWDNEMIQLMSDIDFLSFFFKVTLTLPYFELPMKSCLLCYLFVLSPCLSLSLSFVE